MSAYWPLLLASLISVSAIAALAWGDPKRRRARTKTAARGDAFSSSARRTLWTLALAPGVVLALRVEGAALVMWLGIAGTAGWLYALLGNGQDAPAAARRRTQRSQPSST